VATTTLQTSRRLLAVAKFTSFKIYVLFQAVHSAAVRDNVCCTLRVCEVILNLVELLLDMGILKQCLRDEVSASGGVNHSVSILVSGHGHSNHISHQGSCKESKETEYVSPSTEKEPSKISGGSQKGTSRLQTPHSLIMSCVIRFVLLIFRVPRYIN
jgi:hypothetical protein